MKTPKRLLPLLAAACLFPALARAYSPEAYPGWTWGNLSRDFEGLEGSGSQGNVNQGVQWLTLPGGVPFTTYAFYSWRERSQNQQFYNADGPGVGLFFSKGVFDLGFDYNSEHYPQLGETVNDEEVYLKWYKRVDLTGSLDKPNVLGLPFLAAPLTTWGNLTDDFTALEGRGTMGWVSQGIDWCRFPGNVLFSTQGTFYWRLRSDNRQYYNDYAPALGINLDWKWFDLTAESRWDRYPDNNYQTIQAYRVFLTWYYTWDLKKLL